MIEILRDNVFRDINSPGEYLEKGGKFWLVRERE